MVQFYKNWGYRCGLRLKIEFVRTIALRYLAEDGPANHNIPRAIINGSSEKSVGEIL